MPNEILRGVSHESYHKDMFPGSPRLSRTTAVRLLDYSPLHAREAHPFFMGGCAKVPTKGMDKGSLIHELLLEDGPGWEVVLVHFDKARIGPRSPATNFRKDEAQEERDRIRAEGRIPVLAHELEAAQEACEVIRGRLEDEGEPLGASEREVTLLWEESGVPCKARLDSLKVEDDRVRLRDIKVPATPGRPAAFQRSISWSGLDMQAYVYQRALGVINPEWAGRTDFRFLWVESWHPFDVAWVPLSASQLDVGRLKWERALKTWRECMSSGIWRGYGELEPVEAPSSALEAEMSAHYAATPEPAWVTGGDDNG